MSNPTPSLGKSFDDIRAAYPGLGLSIYALEPGGPVTLEVLGLDGQLYSFVGNSERQVLDMAFPADKPEPTPEPPAAAEPQQPNVFD